MCGALSDKRTDLSFTIADGHRQRSHSGPSLAGPMTIFDCLRFATPLPGGPGPRIYHPLEQGSPVIHPGTGFPSRRLLRLAGIRRRYYTRFHKRSWSLKISVSYFTTSGLPPIS
jgi:hypothetical protein